MANCLLCPGHVHNLVQSWLPSLDGVTAKLERGALVADSGCGHGASTMVMAKAYPTSTFLGFDYHDPSIERARQAAVEEFLDNAHFKVANATNFPRHENHACDLVSAGFSTRCRPRSVCPLR